jgi:hypothetical protein
MKTNKEMYNEYLKAMQMVERYKHWDYIDNYKDMKREEALYDKYYTIAGELLNKILTLKKYAKLTITKDFPICDFETGEYTGEVQTEEMQLYVIGKQAKDDIALFVTEHHVYTGEMIKKLGWKTQRINGKIVYDAVYNC